MSVLGVYLTLTKYTFVWKGFVEKNAVEEKKTFNLTYLYLAFGVVLGLVFVFAYAIPYMNAVR